MQETSIILCRHLDLPSPIYMHCIKLIRDGTNFRPILYRHKSLQYELVPNFCLYKLYLFFSLEVETGSFISESFQIKIITASTCVIYAPMDNFIVFTGAHITLCLFPEQIKFDPSCDITCQVIGQSQKNTLLFCDINNRYNIIYVCNKKSLGPSWTSFFLEHSFFILCSSWPRKLRL